MIDGGGNMNKIERNIMSDLFETLGTAIFVILLLGIPAFLVISIVYYWPIVVPIIFSGILLVEIGYLFEVFYFKAFGESWF